MERISNAASTSGSVKYVTRRIDLEKDFEVESKYEIVDIIGYEQGSSWGKTWREATLILREKN